ncbi:hypothetical protein CCYA_CCYA01G0093 [Cyanidiococcus yangmingshanensis]|nr:hypothetical protein CCYA_CCYA01G0093 [Cyanidiococcus yangmingshanensis]
MLDRCTVSAFLFAAQPMRKRKTLSRSLRTRREPALGRRMVPRPASHPLSSFVLSADRKETGFDLAKLEKRLRYRFGRYPELAKLAFLHPAGPKEGQNERRLNNERLEFLGDAILSAIIADNLYRQLPESQEGELSVVRAAVVSREACARYFVKLDLLGFLDFGPVSPKVHQQLARTRNIRANAFEAILGAIYLDGGYEAAMRFFLMHFADDLLQNQAHPAPNYKSTLQEWASQQKNAILDPPQYELVKKSGSAHNPLFHIRLSLRMRVAPKSLECHGSGRTKRQAEQAAAKALLSQLGITVERPILKGMEQASLGRGLQATVDVNSAAPSEVSSKHSSMSTTTMTSATPGIHKLVSAQRGSQTAESRRNTIDAVRRSTDLELVVSAAYGGSSATLADICALFSKTYTIPVAMSCLSHFAIMGSAMTNADGIPRSLFEQLVWAVLLDRSMLTLVDDGPLVTEEERLPSGQRMLRLYSQSAGSGDAPLLESLALGAESANFFFARRVVVPRSEKTTAMGMFVRFHGCLVPERNCLDGSFIANDITQAWLTALVATVALMFETEGGSRSLDEHDAGEASPMASHSSWTRLYLRNAVQDWSKSPTAGNLARLRLGCARALHEIHGHGLLYWENLNESMSVHASMLVQFARIWLRL